MINVNRKYSEVAKLKDLAKLEKQVKEALKLASTHDPDHQRRFNELYKRVDALEQRFKDLDNWSVSCYKKGKRK